MAESQIIAGTSRNKERPIANKNLVKFSIMVISTTLIPSVQSHVILTTLVLQVSLAVLIELVLKKWTLY